MKGAGNLSGAHKDDGLAQLLTLREDHLLQHHHFVDGRGALLQVSVIVRHQTMVRQPKMHRLPAESEQRYVNVHMRSLTTWYCLMTSSERSSLGTKTCAV